MSRNGSINNIVKEIDQRIEEIWNRPPSEIENLLEVKGLCRQSFNLVIYAYWDTNALASTLWTLRRNAQSGVPISSLATVTGSIVDSHARSLEAYGLLDTAELLGKVSPILSQVKESREYIMLVERLVVYLNRLGMAGWLDLLIPWQELGETFEEALRSDRPNLVAR
jgi:hypothetical protein